MRVCVVGLGVVGLPTATYIKGRGIDVSGYDISVAASDLARKQGIVDAASNWQNVPPADIYVICVSTRLREGLPDMSAVLAVCSEISQRPAPYLLSIESTILPGTSRRIFEDVFRRKTSVVHVPHRYWSGDPVRHGVRQERVIGAVDSKSLSRGLEFYRGLLGIPVHITPKIEVAELSKVAENAYRFVQIAFAEELRMTCKEIGLDFSDVREACNKKWNIEILEARDGIGGHCLPKDIRYLASLSIKTILSKGAILVDEEYRKWVRQNSLGDS